MRRDFFPYLYTLMQANKDIVVLTGDLGYGGFDRIRDDFPDRFYNCGAAEFAMMGIAVGLAMSGKIPVVYSITPFLLYRPFEVIRTYINYEKIPIIMIGSGRGNDYKHDGFSHYAGDDIVFMQHFRNIINRWPENTEQMKNELKRAIEDRRCATYINLKR
jgi:transketolase